MDAIVWFIVGFLACLILSRGWIILQIEVATKAYDRAIAMHEETRALITQAQDTTGEDT